MGASGALGEADERSKFTRFTTSGASTDYARTASFTTVTDGHFIINELTKSESSYPSYTCLDYCHEEETAWDATAQDACNTGDTEQKKSRDQ